LRSRGRYLAATLVASPRASEAEKKCILKDCPGRLVAAELGGRWKLVFYI
jgi:hypothetical protein